MDGSDATTPDPPTLPRRGEKDFEPHGTHAQVATLTASRAAMHAALSRQRTHPPSKSAAAPLMGTYTASPAPSRPTTHQKTPWRTSQYCAVVQNPRGTHFRTIGKVGPDGLLRLLPEEALYLLERGSLDLRWPGIRGESDADEDADEDGDEDGNGDEHEDDNEAEGQENEDEDEAEEDHDEDVDADEDAESGTDTDATASVPEAGVPLSLQAAYACLVGTSGLTLERYTVYAGLKRSGYIVQRGPAWDPEDDVDIDDVDMADVGTTSPVADSSTQQLFEQKPLARFGWLYRTIFGTSPTHPPPRGPLVPPGLYRSYSGFPPWSFVWSHRSGSFQSIIRAGLPSGTLTFLANQNR